MTLSPDILAAATHFDVQGEAVSCNPLPGGHIHESHVLGFRRGARVERFLLQRMNTRVFPRPELVMENMVRVTAHLRRKFAAEGAADLDRCVLTPVGAGSRLIWRDEMGGCWRMFHYIERTRTCTNVPGPLEAERAARAFGEFQRMLVDLPPPRLLETLPGFHDTSARFEALDRALAVDSLGRAAGAKGEIDFALRQRSLADVLSHARRTGAIPERVVHNDAKIANVLFDESTGEALCIVDLDTIMPGLALHDFGDMVRSMTCTAAEDEANLDAVQVDPPLFEAVTRGYLAEMGGALTGAEREHLLTAGKLITLEQGVRFLTDHLCGDRYYRTISPEQNLNRCRTQFALVESIERNESQLRQIIRSILW